MPPPKEREDDPWSRSLLASPTPSDEPEDDFEPPHLNGAFIELSHDTDLAAELDLSRREDRAVVRETPFTLANLRAAASGKGKSQAKDAGEGRRPRYGGNIATADSLLEPSNRPAQAAGAGPSQVKRDWKNDSGWTDSGGNPLPHCPPSKKGKRKAEEGSTRVIQPAKAAKRQTTLFNSVTVPSNTNGTKTAKRPVARNNPNPQPAKGKKKKGGEDKIEFRRLPTISDNREFPIVAGLERQRSLPTKSPGPKPKVVPKSKPAPKKGKFVPPAPAPTRQTKLDIDALVGGISARPNKAMAIKPRKTVVDNNSQGSSSSSGGGDAIDRLLGIGKYEANQPSHPVGGQGPAPPPSYLHEQTITNGEKLDDEPHLIRGESTVPADLLETPPTPPYAPPHRPRSIDNIPKAPSVPRSLPPIVRPTPVREVSVVEMLEALAESGFDGSTLPKQGTSQAQESASQVPDFNGQAYHNILRPSLHSPILHHDGHDGHVHQHDHQLTTGYGSPPQPHVLDSRAPYTPLSPQFGEQRREYSQGYQQPQPSIPHRFSQPPQYQQGVPNSVSPPAGGTYHSFSQPQEQQPHRQSQQSQHFRQSEPSRGSTPQVQATPVRLNTFAYNSSQSQPSRSSQPVRSALRHWQSLLDKPTPDDTDWSTLPKRGTRLTIRPDQPKTSGRFKLPLEVFDRPKPAGRTSYSSLSISEPNRRNAEAGPSHSRPDDYPASSAQPHPPTQPQSTGVKLTVWTPTPMRHKAMPQPNKYVPPHIRVLEQAASESSDEYGKASTPGSSTMHANQYASAPGPSTVRANPYPTPAHTHVQTQQTQQSQQGSDDDWTAVWGRSANVASTIAREVDQM